MHSTADFSARMHTAGPLPIECRFCADAGRYEGGVERVAQRMVRAGSRDGGELAPGRAAKFIGQKGNALK
jgi:hypothetical protein